MNDAPQAHGQEERPAAAAAARPHAEASDLDSVSAVIRALSAEREPGRLLSTIMRLALTRTGARYGCVLLRHDGNLVVAAHGRLGPDGRTPEVHTDPRVIAAAVEPGRTGSEQTYPRKSEPEKAEAEKAEPGTAIRDEEAGAYPPDVAAAVLRTLDWVVLADAAGQGPFTDDPYLRRRRTASLACAPLAGRDGPIGALYLEDDLSTHTFTPEKIQFLELVLPSVALSLENARLSGALRENGASGREPGRLGRELRAMRRCSQSMMRAEDERSLIQDICRIICDEGGYQLAWVAYVEHDEARTLRPAAWAGDGSDYVAHARISWAEDTVPGSGPAGMVVRTGEIVVVQDFETDERMRPWQQIALGHGYHSGIALPLKDEAEQVFGVLMIYSGERDAITAAEIRLMDDLAHDLAFGISALRTRSHLRVSEEKYRTLVQNIQVAVIVHAADTRILTFNAMAQELLGLTYAQMMGRAASDSAWRFLRADGTPLPADEYPVYRVLASRMPMRNVMFGVQRSIDGRDLWVLVSADPIFNTSGELEQVVVTFVDMTERKLAEEALQRVNTELERRVAEDATRIALADRQFKGLARWITVELRTPLDRISDYLGSLAAPGTPSGEEPDLRDALAAAGRMDTLIGQLLAFALLGERAPAIVQIDLNLLVDEVIGELEPETAGRAVEWRIEPLPVVTADHEMLRTVLVNLLSNAVKFTRPRPLAVIEIGQRQGAGTEVIVSVSDNGVGFDAASADELFALFQRLHGETEFEGTGLGLATARRIVERHGGRIWAEGAADRGATISFSLPRRTLGPA